MYNHFTVLLGLVIVVNVSLCQETRISQENSTYFEYNKFNNSLFYAQSELIGDEVRELKLDSGIFYPTDFWRIVPAMFNHSYKCIYEVHTDSSAIWYLRDFESGEDSALVVFGSGSKSKFLPDPYYSISPNDKRMMYVFGWGVDLETGEFFSSPSTYDPKGYDLPFAWKNDYSVYYVSSKNKISEYNIEIGKVFDVLEVELEDDDEILTLDYNPIYKLIAFSTGKMSFDQKVYLYSINSQQLSIIPDFPNTFGPVHETRELAWSPNGQILAGANFNYLSPTTYLGIYELIHDKVTDLSGVAPVLVDLTWLNDSTVAYWSDQTHQIYKYNLTDYVTNIEGNNEYNSSEDDLQISAYPNPFNSGVTISFNSDNFSNYSIEIFNVIGKLIYKNDQSMEWRGGQFYWNGKSNSNKQTSSGIYYCVLRDLDRKISKTVKIIMLK
ncbi:MAG: gliding motility-associated C-terminal domain-containing protein [Melioribacteraceae bacterium]|nr:gliding motility-associated C-terminal domain-containing protein [Melioribacteraceae bacterium]